MKSKMQFLQLFALIATFPIVFGFTSYYNSPTPSENETLNQQQLMNSINPMEETLNPKSSADEMIVQIITLKSELPENELLEIAQERSERFKELPGLIQKYYLRLDEPGMYRGIYIWDSKKSMMAFKQSELAATIPTAYKIQGKPDVKISNLLFQLRE